jgi:hypothetical protein
MSKKITETLKRDLLVALGGQRETVNELVDSLQDTFDKFNAFLEYLDDSNEFADEDHKEKYGIE